MRSLSCKEGVSARFPARQGFTLVELLVAMSVLVIIGVLLAQIISATSNTTVLSNRNVDAASQSRIAFDRIQLDVAGWIKRSDIDCVLQNSPAGTTPPVPLMQFFSAVSSSGISPRTNNRNISLISYEMRPHADNPDSSKSGRLCLTRAGMPVPWNVAGYTHNGQAWASGAAFMGLKSDGLPVRMDDPSSPNLFPAALIPQGPSGSSTGDFDVVAAGVIRMVVGFQLYPSGEAVRLAGPSGTVDGRGQVVYAPPLRSLAPNSGPAVDYVDVNGIASLVVGVVAIDTESLRSLSAQNVADLAAAFPVPADGQLPVKSWASIAGNPNSFPSSIPLPARQALRVYQRAYPVYPFAQNGF